MSLTEVTDSLYLGDIRDARTESLSDHGVDVVVTICQESVEDNVGCSTYHHFSLSDGKPVGHVPGEFDYELFQQAVDTIRTHLAVGDTVFVHCHAGQSRSVSAVACVLACDYGYGIDEAYWHLRTLRETNVSDDLRYLASKYMNRQ